MNNNDKKVSGIRHIDNDHEKDVGICYINDYTEKKKYHASPMLSQIDFQLGSPDPLNVVPFVAEKCSLFHF